MVATFESILPIFLLLVAGNLLRRAPVFDPATWRGLEQLAFWFLYPILLFNTIYNADFTGLKLNSLIISLFAAIIVMGLLLAVLWPVSRATGLIAHSQYSSVFQTSIRWNGFMAFAIAEKIFPPQGIAIVALVMAAIIIPINVQSVYVLARFSDRDANWANVARKIATNPLILASLAAILVRIAPFGLYPPFAVALNLVGRAALGMGLIAIGAGLRPEDLVSPTPAVWIPVTLKLVVFPVILLAIAASMGIDGSTLNYLALCAAVPTAMNGYLLARQMGGDAELYAAVVTLQTAASFLTIPLFLNVANYIAGG